MRAPGASSQIILAALFCVTTAQAADMRGVLAPESTPRPTVYGDSGFYLRGNLGYGATRSSNILFLPANGAGERTLSRSTRASGLISVGAGYQVNALLRGDVTLEQRSQSRFRFQDRVENAGSPALPYINDVNGKLSARVALVNGYVNLGSWDRFTPFVGVGLGVASLTTSDVTLAGVGPGNPGAKGRSDKATSQSLAWALHTGFDYHLGANWHLETSYRYLNMGTAKGGEINCFSVSTGSYSRCGYNPNVKGFGAHDVRLGVRYLFAAPAALPAFSPQPGYAGGLVSAPIAAAEAMPLTRKY
jgi:opacity protein-like surface antigen